MQSGRQVVPVARRRQERQVLGAKAMDQIHPAQVLRV